MPDDRMPDLERDLWEDEDKYWQQNYSSRPYAQGGGQAYDYYRPAYRYGYDSASRHQGRNWSDVESDLERGWHSYEHHGTEKTTWESVKDAVRDAWDRVTGRSKTRA
jgi:hypothetical protein